MLGVGTPGPGTAEETPRGAGAPPDHALQSPEQLQQLVAPIALYSDPLVAQVLTAATFPEQVVEADRWLQANPGLQGAALAQAADQQSWDASVKGLTAFPAVLGNMDKNLSWTSSLGDAYYNQPQDVMAAIQVMRQRASATGNLASTPQQVVATQDSDITIEPANADVIYVPAYDPWIVYGAPVLPWPAWYPYPGIWYAGPYLYFGAGIAIGYFGGFGWGWHHWGCDWHHHHVALDRQPYFSRSTTFYNRQNYYGGRGRGGVGAEPWRAPAGSAAGGAHPAPPTGHAAPPGRPGPPAGGWGHAFTNPGVAARPFNGSVPAARGYAAPRGQSGVHSGAFSGYSRGGETRSFSSRGSVSVGGGSRGAGHR